MATIGTVRSWYDAEGWGVVDSPETPGGCWTHFSHLAEAGLRALQPGQRVVFRWEAPGQDGYPFRAVQVWREGHDADPTTTTDTPSGAAYRSHLSIHFDDRPATN
jgi:CspA family cold shock protein